MILFLSILIIIYVVNHKIQVCVYVYIHKLIYLEVLWEYNIHTKTKVNMYFEIIPINPSNRTYSFCYSLYSPLLISSNLCDPIILISPPHCHWNITGVLDMYRLSLKNTPCVINISYRQIIRKKSLLST